MKHNFDYAFDLLMSSEGGFVNDPDDSGGMTNLGVTKKAWEAYAGRPVTEGEMRGLSPDKVKSFYKKEYWDKVRGDDLPGGTDYAAFDFAVNAGVAQSVKFLQRAASVKDDGVMGPITAKAIERIPSYALLASFTRQKEDFYRGLVEKNASQAKFLKGWLHRTAVVHTKAGSMLA